MQQGVASNQMLAKTFVTDSCLIVIQCKHSLNIAKCQLAIPPYDKRYQWSKKILKRWYTRPCRTDCITRVTGVKRMTRVRYLSSYLECSSRLGYTSMWSLWAVLFIIFSSSIARPSSSSDDGRAGRHTESISTYRLGPSDKTKIWATEMWTCVCHKHPGDVGPK